MRPACARTGCRDSALRPRRPSGRRYCGAQPRNAAPRGVGAPSVLARRKRQARGAGGRPLRSAPLQGRRSATCAPRSVSPRTGRSRARPVRRKSGAKPRRAWPGQGPSRRTRGPPGGCKTSRTIRGSVRPNRCRAALQNAVCGPARTACSGGRTRTWAVSPGTGPPRIRPAAAST